MNAEGLLSVCASGGRVRVQLAPPLWMELSARLTHVSRMSEQMPEEEAALVLQLSARYLPAQPQRFVWAAARAVSALQKRRARPNCRLLSPLQDLLEDEGLLLLYQEGSSLPYQVQGEASQERKEQLMNEQF